MKIVVRKQLHYLPKVESLFKNLIFYRKGNCFSVCFRGSDQKSDGIQLVVGQKYFIEAILISSTASNHMTVAMELPDGTFVGPITNEYLSKHAD